MAESYKTNAELSYDLPWMLKMQPVAAGLIAMAWIDLDLFHCSDEHISTANYLAFNVSYGMGKLCNFIILRHRSYARELETDPGNYSSDSTNGT
jgi:hypothetical protein